MTCSTRNLSIAGGLMLGFALFPMAAGAEPPEAATSLTQLIRQADDHNPEILAARLQWQARQERARYAGSLEAPRANAAVMNPLGFMGPSLSVTQAFPGGGRLGLLGEAAAHEAEQGEAEYERTRLKIVGDLTAAYDEFVAAVQALEIHHAVYDQLRHLRAIATARYAVGRGLLADSLRAQVELSRLLNRELEIEQTIVTDRARVNTLASRPLEAPIALTKFQSPPSPVLDGADLMRRAEAKSPIVAGLKAQVAASEVAQTIAQREQRTPDYELGIQAGRSMPGDVPYLGGVVGITLPWLAPGRYQARVTEAEQGLMATRARYQSARNDLRFQVLSLGQKLERIDHQLQVYREGIVPQSIQALNAALAAYQVGKADFSNVIDDQKAVYEARMEQATLLGEYGATQAKLEAAVAAPIAGLK